MPALLLATGCDLGEAAHDPVQGPPLHVVATYPANGQGTDCAPDSPPDCGVPLNTTIELRLDRYVDPRTAVRQAIHLYTGDPAVNRVTEFEPEYDLVERVLVFRFLDGIQLHPRTLYNVRILVPAEEDSDGLRAFDQAPLEPGGVPLEFSFVTGETLAPPRLPPRVPSCFQIVQQMLVPAGCAATNCHNANDSDPGRMGMDLVSERGMVLSVINQVAHQTDLGPTSGVIFESPSRFGVNMARVQRDAPENSYLFYKALRDPQNFRLSTADGEEPCAPDSEPVHEVAVPEGTCFAPSAAESERLREWFVRGESMPIRRPPQPGGTVGRGLTRDQLRQLQTWIRAGAPCL